MILNALMIPEFPTPKEVGSSEILKRILRGFCANCGRGKLMKNWFSVYAKCSRCGCNFPVKEGSFLGSMAINYGLAVFIVLPAWLLIWKLLNLSVNVLLYGAIVVAVLSPVIIYPFAWRLWIWICTEFLQDDQPTDL